MRDLFLEKYRTFHVIIGSVFLCYALHATERSLALARLIAVYPDQIKAIGAYDIVWTDNTHMPIEDSDPTKSVSDKLEAPTLADQLEQPSYLVGKPTHNPQDDPGRIRYEPFFRKMYGNSPGEVESHLKKITWMPRVFGADAPLLFVTKMKRF